jgi:hypothetical protein
VLAIAFRCMDAAPAAQHAPHRGLCGQDGTGARQMFEDEGKARLQLHHG